ncbi:MAG: indole-3-glycerol-phosphate synthase [Deltaproteobacteria bacterium]|nr:indole-3-glycerol-phosphate synthase [Deltaproteobacteria bacterium]
MNTLPRVLAPIVAATLEQLRRDRDAVSLTDLQRQIRTMPAVPSLQEALRRPGLQLIAEFKPRSPSRGVLRQGAEPSQFAKAYRPAAALSVLCDREHFGGGPHLLREFAGLTPQPLLAKGFFVDPYQLAQVRAHGAAAALLIARLLPGAQLAEMLQACGELGLEALVEVHNHAEAELALAAGAEVVGVNARDLDTLHIDLAACRALLAQLPASTCKVAESGVEQPSEVTVLRAMAAQGQVDAVLIGTAFMTAADPAAAVAGLGFA